MRIIEKIFILFTLLVALNCSCSSNCRTCVDPSSSIFRNYCTSCYDNHFFYASTCYHCDLCKGFSLCTDCPDTSQSDMKKYLPIFLGIGGGTFLIGIIIVCICRKCPCKFEEEREVDRNARIVSKVAAISQGRLLERNLEQIEWKRADKKIDSNENCSICLDSEVFLETQCGHTYHPKCIFEWAKRGSNCPLCKAKRLSPVRFFCSQCLEQYVELSLKNLPQLYTEQGWKRCSFCKENI